MNEDFTDSKHIPVTSQEGTLGHAYSASLLENTTIGLHSMIPTNVSTGLQIRDTLLRRIAHNVDFYVVPCIIAAGLIGNSLSFLVFVFTKLRNLSSSVYLAALSISDSGFLLCVFFSWSNNVGIRIYHTQGWCQTFVYLTYIFGFLSVWYIVAFSCERFIAVKYPFKRSQMCTPKRAKIVVISLAVFSVIAYNFAIWTSDIFLWHNMYICCPMDKYRNLIAKLNNIDTVITLVIPFIAILFFNIWIVY